MTINLALDDMMCTCGECEDSFAPEVALKMIGDELAKWEAMCEWIQTAGEILTPVQTLADALPLPALAEVEDETELVAKVFA